MGRGGGKAPLPPPLDPRMNMFCVLKVITDKLTLPYHVFRHLSAITAVRPKPNDVRCAYQIPWWLTPQAPWNVVNMELKHLGL